MVDREAVHETRKSRDMSASGGDGGGEAGTSSRMYKKRPRTTQRRRKAALADNNGSPRVHGKAALRGFEWWRLCGRVAEQPHLI